MRLPPIILISPDFESRGKEFADPSISLSQKYQEAVLAAGGLPFTMPATVCRDEIRACVGRSDGVMLTGGDDIEPSLYAKTLPARLSQTVEVTPDNGERSLRELLVIDEVFRQRKPLLAICRGHQILNVALGGTLVADIPSQVKHALNHRRTAQRSEIVHEVRLTGGSVLAKIADKQIIGVNSTHHQAIGRVAAPLRVSARSSDGVMEGLELKPDRLSLLPFLVSVQFHPERLADRYPEHRAIFNAFTRACKPRGCNSL